MSPGKNVFFLFTEDGTNSMIKTENFTTISLLQMFNTVTSRKQNAQEPKDVQRK